MDSTILFDDRRNLLLYSGNKKDTRKDFHGTESQFGEVIRTRNDR